MISSHKIKSVDFYRKIPRDLTEASLSGAGLSIIAALSMMFLFGMELNNYLTVSTTASVIVDKSSDGEFLRIDFNLSFPSLSCEFASVDVSDVLGTNRLNITKTIRKYSIDSALRPTGSEFHSGPIAQAIKHGDEVDEEYGEGSIQLNANNFDRISHNHPILVVNFYAPWCPWSNRLKPSWEKAARIVRERYDPEMDGRILMGKIDCTEEVELCRRHHIQAYPSIRIFRKGSDVSHCRYNYRHGYGAFSTILMNTLEIPSTYLRFERGRWGLQDGCNLLSLPGGLVCEENFICLASMDDHGHHDHESYYGDRDTDSLVLTMESLVAPIPLESERLALENKSGILTDDTKRPAPRAGGCRIEGFVRVKKVPGNLVISAHSGAHSFDASQINVSHVISHLSFGKKVSPRMMSDMKRVLPYLGGSHDKLEGRAYMIDPNDTKANVTIEHYLQIVKTEVVTRSSREHNLVEYEYTAHSSLIHSPDIPVAKFHFELSPMQVLITEVPKSFSHFITNICAIIGGVFTVAGILDSILHNSLRLMKKVELGKNF